MVAATEQGRTGIDLALGGLQVVVGLVILGHTAAATALSLLFVGWLLFAAGVLVLAGTLFRLGDGGFWTGLVGGGLMTVLGVVFLRQTAAAAVTVTLVAGAMFLSVGIIRLAAAFAIPENRVALLFGGALSLALGLIVLFNIVAASYTLLGVLLGIQVLADGVTTMVVGRDARRASLVAGDPAQPPPASHPRPTS